MRVFCTKHDHLKTMPLVLGMSLWKSSLVLSIRIAISGIAASEVRHIKVSLLHGKTNDSGLAIAIIKGSARDI